MAIPVALCLRNNGSQTPDRWLKLARNIHPNIKKLREEKEKLVLRKNMQYEEYSYARAKYRELQTVHQNIHTIIDIPLSQNEQATPKKGKSEQHI